MESNPLDDSMAGAFATCCGVNLAVQRRIFWSLRDWSLRRLEFPGGSLNRLRTVFRAKTVPEGLKPDSSSSDYGTAEQLAEEGAL
jgi:hypothetical protein